MDAKFNRIKHPLSDQLRPYVSAQGPHRARRGQGLAPHRQRSPSGQL